MNFLATNDAGLEKNCHKIAEEMAMRVVVVKGRSMMLKALQNEIECKVASRLDRHLCTFFYCYRCCNLIRRLNSFPHPTGSQIMAFAHKC